MSRSMLVTGLLGLLAFVAPLKAAPAPGVGKPIDLVICLDISSSMDGLIDSAKIKLWDVVNDLAKIKPTPVFRVALYTYGCDGYDSKKGWIQKDSDLTTDLDEIYKKLNALRTNGGTEFHTGVAKAAIEELKWATEKDALRIIFVCGNEELEQDPVNKLEAVAALAKKQGVVVNTIHCANQSDLTNKSWHRFAELANGKGLNIDQNRAGQEVQIASPQDKQLVQLNDKLNGTYVVYGNKQLRDEKAMNQLTQDREAATAAPGANLARVQSKATALYRNDTWDLIDRMKNDAKFDLKSLKEEELPEVLKKLKVEERVGYLMKKSKERETIQNEIMELSKARADYVAKERAKLPKNDKDAGWDKAIRSALREQCATKGMELPE